MPDPAADAAADLLRLIQLAAAVWQASHTQAGSVTQAMEAHAAHYDLIRERVRDPEYHRSHKAAVAELLTHYARNPAASL